ncbi:MAG: hydantoinase/oxoprolinase N-terminal domain-containing protein, partial [Planctomycetota bacterium]
MLRISIDRGGTFTDVIAHAPNGAVKVFKVLSEDGSGVDPTLRALRAALGLEGLGPDATIPEGSLSEVRVGTTLATNALLERKGAKVALAITEGFADALTIAEQDRPDLFALSIERPAPLESFTLEVAERVLFDGTLDRALCEESLRRDLRAAREAGCTSLACVLVHSYAFGAHELRVGQIARELGFAHVSLSHQIAREIHLVARGQTTVLDAYLTPVIAAYVARLREALPASTRLLFMQSAGGLAHASRFRGCDAILSGPAGGAIACSHALSKASARTLKPIAGVIGFDMGGTSTDVCRVTASGLPRIRERKVAGFRVRTESLEVRTVAAGGGSILGFRDGRLRVGPESAGASPGSAAYGRGGPATV